MEQTTQTPQMPKTSPRKWMIATGLVASLAFIGIVGAKALDHDMSKNGMDSHTMGDHKMGQDSQGQKPNEHMQKMMQGMQKGDHSSMHEHMQARMMEHMQSMHSKMGSGHEGMSEHKQMKNGDQDEDHSKHGAAQGEATPNKKN